MGDGGTGAASRRRRRWAVRQTARRRAAYTARQARWSRIDRQLRDLARTARTFTGHPAGGGTGQILLILRDGERMICRVPAVTLVRMHGTPRAPTGRFAPYSALTAADLAEPTRSTGAAPRRAPRRPAPRPLESGPVTVTDQRVVFHGASSDWEWSLARLVEIRHGEVEPVTLIQTRDRPELSGLRYRRHRAPMLRFGLSLAQARHSGGVDGLVSRLEADRAVHDGARPPVVTPARPEDAPGIATAALRAVATVYFGRAGQPLRWRIAQFVAALVATAGVLALVIPQG